MSASSGILPSAELKDAWAAAQADAALRCLSVVIKDEQLVPGITVSKAGSAEQDYGLLEGHAAPKVPQFFLFRLDSGSWLLVIYVPDVAPVRSKMLYASSRANLTRALGDSYFTDSLHAHSPADLTTAAYGAHIRHSTSEAPLTEREQELASLKEAEGIEARGTSSRGSAFSTSADAKGILPWDEGAVEALKSWAEPAIGAIHLALDVPRETVTLLSTSPSDHWAIPTNTPSYNIISHANLFTLIYCCPASSPIKNRMLYSSSVRGVAQRANEYGVSIAKRLETSDPADVTVSWLESELNVSQDQSGAKLSTSPTTTFARPKRPGAGRVQRPDPATALPAQTTEGEGHLP